MYQLSLCGVTNTGQSLGQIRNHYWILRSLRPLKINQARRRKEYRQIQKIKAVLIADGLDSELLRLWCRQWSSCHQAAARERFTKYLQKFDAETKKTLSA